jgi:endogenous inhibitor of DNA gyrase (YacG/DUF329 family)
MGLPRINVASLQCPQCAGLTRLVGVSRADSPDGNETLSFECDDCGPFEVLALADGDSDPFCSGRLARPGAEVQDLWA